MNYEIVNRPTIELTPKWERFVYNHPQGNVFQTHYMYKVYGQSTDYTPFVFIMLDGEGDIVGSLLSVVQSFGGKLAGSFGSRSLIIGGPLVKNNSPDLLRNILSEYSSSARKKAVLTEIRNIFNIDGSKGLFREDGYEYTDHLNLLVDLTKSEDQLWKEVYSKRRNLVRRAYKEGTYFGQIETQAELKKCYNILKEVYDRAKLPLPDFSLFSTAWKNSDKINGLNVFTAINENRIIGTMFSLYHKGTLYDWYAGSYQEFYKKYPNDMIPWEVFLWGKKNGSLLFDFGGAGKHGGDLARGCARAFGVGRTHRHCHCLAIRCICQQERGHA